MILTIKTDQPEATITLQADVEIDSISWQAHRELSNTLMIKIKELLSKNDRKLQELEGVIVFSGPGSFTGLRIGHTVGNTLAYSLKIPIVATGGENWIKNGVSRLNDSQDDKIVTPEYGNEANITKPRK